MADVRRQTAAESRIAVLLCEGMAAVDIAVATGIKVSTVNTLNTLIQRDYRKLGISRQAELMRQVFLLEEVSTFRPFHPL